MCTSVCKNLDTWKRVQAGEEIQTQSRQQELPGWLPSRRKGEVGKGLTEHLAGQHVLGPSEQMQSRSLEGKAETNTDRPGRQALLSRMQDGLPQHQELCKAISFLSQERMLAFLQTAFFFQWVPRPITSEARTPSVCGELVVLPFPLHHNVVACLESGGALSVAGKRRDLFPLA